MTDAAIILKSDETIGSILSACFANGRSLSRDDSGSQIEEAIDFKAPFVTSIRNPVILALFPAHQFAPAFYEDY